MIDATDDPPKLARMITCRWCAGMWIAGGVVLARAVAPKAWDSVAKGLALSAGAALLAGFKDRLTPRRVTDGALSATGRDEFRR